MNRRSEPRFEVYYRAKIFSVDQPETAVDALLTDISGGGMRLVATEELAEDQVVCVEVGQHLVLAEVRNSVPRGSRFAIGAEKIHTLNLLTLPESMSLLDRIQALIDDYHRKIQLALEDRSPAEASSPVVQPKVYNAPIERPATPITPAPSETTPVVAASAPDVEPPGLAPSLISDPMPADVRVEPLKSAVEVDFGRLQIMLPEATAPEIVPATERLSIEETADTFNRDNVQDVICLGGIVEPDAAPPRELDTELPPPAQPIWMSPPAEAGASFDLPQSDRLRVLAIQQQISEPRFSLDPPNHSRRIAFLAAGLVATVVLVSSLYGPIRNRLTLLSASASATENRPYPRASVDSTEQEVRISAAATPAAPAAVAPLAQPKPAPLQAAPAERVHSSSIRTSASSWLWACTDGKPLEGRVLPGGSSLEIEFTHGAKVVIGNAGGVEIALDGNPLGAIGPSGQARVVELSPEGFHIAVSTSQECGGR